MLIRRYEHRDAEAVRNLFVRVNRALAPPGMREAFDSYIALAIREEIGRIDDYYAGPRRGFWVAEDPSGTIVGTFGLEPAGEDAAELRRMYVAPEAHRRGIARAMLAEAEHVVAGWRLARLVLNTAEIQEAALAFYRSAGYRLVWEEVAEAVSNKTAGAGLRHFHFEKDLRTRATSVTREGHTGSVLDHLLVRHEGAAPAARLWLRDHSPGYFALVMATGIVAVAARLLGHTAVAWSLFAISLAAYPLLWAILLARIVIFPHAVLADFVSHERGPAFLTIVAANAVLVGEFATFNVLESLLPLLFWSGLVLWAVLVYGFLSAVTVSIAKPGLEHGLNGSWLLLVVATESIAVMGSFLALRSGEPPPLVFASLAFYLLGTTLYVMLSALIFFRWVFRPMHPAEIGAPWWINMGAVAIATLAGARLMVLPGTDPNLLLLQRFVTPFTVLLWANSTFWIPLLVILFAWKEMQRGPHGYDPGLWSVVFPLGMYVVATHEYSTVAHLPFLAVIPRAMFWVALLAWVLSFIGMCMRLL